MELLELRAFLTVVNEGSFSRAAVRLHRTQPAISQAVRRRLLPDRRTLDAAYKAARRERWRRRVAEDWRATETEKWPE